MAGALDPVLAAKLVVTPVMIGAISFAARRFGPLFGGALAGLPWTSGTVSVFLALEAGPAFAGAAAHSTAGAVPAVVAFCAAYAAIARQGWWLSVMAGLVAFLATVTLTVRWVPEPWVAFSVSVAVLGLALLLFPRRTKVPGSPPPALWDIPVRMVAATAVVLILTGAAHVLGPAWTGALSPFPVFASVLAAFTHRHYGAAAAIDLLRGVMIGLISFSAFFLVVGTLLPAQDLGPTYLWAVAAALLTNLIGWAVWFQLRQKRERTTSPGAFTAEDDGPMT